MYLGSGSTLVDGCVRQFSKYWGKSFPVRLNGGRGMPESFRNLESAIVLETVPDPPASKWDGGRQKTAQKNVAAPNSADSARDIGYREPILYNRYCRQLKSYGDWCSSLVERY